MNGRIWFFVIAAVFEAIAIAAGIYAQMAWVVDVLIALFVIYMIVLAVRGWRKQVMLNFPAIMKGTTVRKRHWHLF